MVNRTDCQYKVVGLMSGTSLDGVDIAYCLFNYGVNGWTYEITESETVKYSDEWILELSSLENASAIRFQQTDAEYGSYLGNLVKCFVEKHNLSPDFVASHGHTIFHASFTNRLLKSSQGQVLTSRLTTQIGAGSNLAATSKLTVINDFRSVDVALGGQGAPLVPIGDKLLFSAYNYCLNIGGFTNVSYNYNDERIAFDICPANIVLNAICETIDLSYDDGGKLARSGHVNESFLTDLNNLEYYKLPKNSPKSLGKEWVVEYINPLLESYDLAVPDSLATFCEHIAIQLSRSLEGDKTSRILVTGGGVFNDYLIERIKHHTELEIVIPANQLVDFKEALLFAFLGVLRYRNEINCLKSVTGASQDNIGGSIYTMA